MGYAFRNMGAKLDPGEKRRFRNPDAAANPAYRKVGPVSQFVGGGLTNVEVLLYFAYCHVDAFLSAHFHKPPIEYENKTSCRVFPYTMLRRPLECMKSSCQPKRKRV